MNLTKNNKDHKMEKSKPITLTGNFVEIPTDENATPEAAIETKANASLTAAAPEMLDFLKRLDYEMYSNPETREWKTEMYELINKAEGK